MSIEIDRLDELEDKAVTTHVVSDFIDDELSGSVIREHGEINGQSYTADFVVDYEKQRFLPLSGFDVHQEALFTYGIELCDEFLAQETTETLTAESLLDTATPNEGDDSEGVEDKDATAQQVLTREQIEQIRTDLIFAKIDHEAARDRPEIVAWLCNEIVKPEDKIRLLDVALSTNGEASLEMFAYLRDLRSEIDNTKDLGLLTEYLVTEIKHGLNLYENTQAVLTLIDDNNNSHDLTQEELAKIVFPIAKAKILAAHDELEIYAIALTLESFPKEFNLIRGVAAFAERRLSDEANKLDLSDARNDKFIKQFFKTKTKRRNFPDSYWNEPARKAYFREMVYLTLTYPEIGKHYLQGVKHAKSFIASYLTNEYQKVQVNKPNGTGKEVVTDEVLEGEGKVLAEEFLRIFGQNSNMWQDETNEERHARFKAEDRKLQVHSKSHYLEALAEGVTLEGINLLYEQSSFQTLREINLRGQNKEDINHAATMHARLDLIETEKNQDALVLNEHDPVDISRHRQKYNRELDQVFTDCLEKIHSPYDRLIVAYRMLHIQKNHDQSDDSQYTDMKNFFKQCAEQCINNPVIVHILSPDEVRHMCSDLEIELETA